MLRAIGTGSWLSSALHGRGIGTEMRAAVLEFAFEGLGSHEAVSGAYDVTPDRQPILGAVPGHERLFLAAGFSGHGFMIAPAICWSSVVLMPQIFPVWR